MLNSVVIQAINRLHVSSLLTITFYYNLINYMLHARNYLASLRVMRILELLLVILIKPTALIYLLRAIDHL